jgi:hypothetical protein
MSPSAEFEFAHAACAAPNATPLNSTWNTGLQLWRLSQSIRGGFDQAWRTFAGRLD